MSVAAPPAGTGEPAPARAVARRRPWSAWTGTGERTPQYLVLVAAVAVLNIIGCVMVLSASSVSSLRSYGSWSYFFQRQLLWTVLGVAAFVAVSRLDHRLLRRAVVPLLAVTVVLLVLVLVPGVGVEVGGARRWLGVGSWRLQPSELAKLALLVFAADVLARRADELHDWRRVLRPVLVVTAAVGALVLVEPDMDSTIVLVLVVGSVLVVGGVRLHHLAALAGAGVLLAAAAALAEPYRRARVLAFLHPWEDASNTGYQISQSLIAIGSGGWTGVGLGAGRAKWAFLPNAHTDFIFAIIGEELGLLGCLLVVGLFVVVAAAGTATCLRAPDRFGALLAAGVTTWIVAQAAINVGAVTGLLPVSGITLPYVSFGGSSLVVTMAATGVLASVARRCRR